MGEFEEYKIVSGERADVAASGGEEKKDSQRPDRAELDDLLKWFKEILGDRVGEVRDSNRLVDSPAILVNPTGFMTAGMERLMHASQPEEGEKFARRDLEINPDHEIIRGLDSGRKEDDDLARIMAEQILDSAMIQAGLPVAGRDMVKRSQEMMREVIRLKAEGLSG